MENNEIKNIKIKFRYIFSSFIALLPFIKCKRAEGSESQMKKSNKTTDGGPKDLYAKFVKKKILLIVGLGFLLIFLIAFSISVGSAEVGIVDTFCVISHRIFGHPSSINEVTETIVIQIRLPRVLMACVAGVGLAVAGAVFQGILRNPLASPYTLGIASAATFGAALAIIMGAGVVTWHGMEFTRPILMVIGAFFFSMISAGIILGLARLKGPSPTTMILTGIAMMYLFTAGVSLLQYFARPESVAAIVFWTFGSLSKATWTNLSIVSLLTFTAIPIFLIWSWNFNALSSGDEVAKSLGVDVSRVRLVATLVASLITATAVCFLGTIAFIGLVAPHITRMVIGGDHRFLIPASCLTGAIILLAADTAARTIISPAVLPVGILTSFMGAPLFIYLILRRRKEYW